MTDEEEIEKQARDICNDLDTTIYDSEGGLINVYDNMEIACLSGIKWGMEHAIEWHDLRENPNDLPKENGRYLVLDEDGDYSVFNVIVNELPLLLFDNINAVAWCELPTYKE